MTPKFHLSIGVKSLEDSVEFFVDILNAKVVHRDTSGYINIDFYGTQITLKANPKFPADLPDFHFGVNLNLAEFNDLADSILKSGREFVTVEPEVWDAGTSMERKKMYLKCPSGYLIELKGYK